LAKSAAFIAEALFYAKELPMHIVVCVKQVARDNTVKINPDRSIGVAGELSANRVDERAIATALELITAQGGSVTIVSLGPDAWHEPLRRALALGATDALLIGDPAFTQLDTLGAARVVAAAVKQLGDVDLIMCGRDSADEESGAFGPALARALGWPQLTYVGKIAELNSRSGRIVVERHLERQIEMVEARLPVVVTVVKGIYESPYPSLPGIKQAAGAEIPVIRVADLGLRAADLAPRVVISARVLTPRPRAEIIQGATAAEQVRKLVDRLVMEQAI